MVERIITSTVNEEAQQLNIKNWYKSCFGFSYRVNSLKELAELTLEELETLENEYVDYMISSFVTGVIKNIDKGYNPYLVFDLVYDICRSKLSDIISDYTKSLLRKIK